MTEKEDFIKELKALLTKYSVSIQVDSIGDETEVYFERSKDDWCVWEYDL